jgi:NADH dehydrogenase
VTRVAVAGASGALGARICKRLRAAGAEVRPLSRPGTDLTVPDTLAAALAGAACVVSTATAFPHDPAPDAVERVDRDGNIALAEAAEAAGVGRFVFVSFPPVPLDFPLQRAKRAVEERLAAAALDAVVLRPDKFMDVWFTPLLGFDPSRRRATIYGDGTSPVSWVAAADVAGIAAEAALGERSGTIEFGGPEALSQREVVAIYEELTGARWTLDEVPADELERRYREAPDQLSRSLAAVTLEAHLGSVAPPLGTTTVREFAADAARQPGGSEPDLTW